MSTLRIAGGRVLIDGAFESADLMLADGRIASLEAPQRSDAEIDARGLLVLPGIVDLHGDGFERQIQPRPGVAFPMDLALVDTERQLLANGVTTAFHGVTLSWEPGLRGIETWRLMLDGLDARRWTCDMRVHLRWEAFNLDALATAVADIEAGRVHLLAFNDHTPSILRALPDPAKAAKFSERGMVSPASFAALAERVAARQGEIAAAHDTIAAAARSAGIPIASHDDATTAMRDAFRSLGATICEFPMAEEVAVAARAAGDAVAMGSPNVVRGGSHLGWTSAARLAEAGLCTVLTSDYFYPCLLRAPFVLAGRGTLDLGRAWALVSSNPASAGELHDRGIVAEGRRADLLLVDAADGVPELVATICEGRIAWAGAQAASRLQHLRTIPA